MRAWILVALALAACTKHPEVSAQAVKRAAAAAETALARTESHHEATLIDAAAALLQRGEPLGADLALRCWQREEKRPRVREACLLAWSAGGMPSNELEGILRQQLAPEMPRNLALALARRPSLVASLKLAEVSTLLGALRREPPWLRALTLRTWLERNSSGLLAGRTLWEQLALPEEAPDPLSLGAGFSVALRIGSAEAAPILSAYCPPIPRGPAFARCLRFLSTLVSPATREGFPPSLRNLLPKRTDPEWAFFARAFPERAWLLEPFLN